MAGYKPRFAREIIAKLLCDDNSNTDIFTNKNGGISRTLVASKMELFVTSVTLVNSFQALTNITKNAIIDVTSGNSNAFSIHKQKYFR